MNCFPNAVPCMLEHKGVQMTCLIPAGRGREAKGKSGSPKPTVSDLLHTLEEIVGTLEHCHVHHSFMTQFVKQVVLCARMHANVIHAYVCVYACPPPQLLYYINGNIMNTIMLRREMCNFEYSIQIELVQF